MSEVRIAEIEDVAKALREMAKRLKISVTALISYPGSASGSLVGLATGSRIQGNVAMGPIFRVFDRAGWELVARPSDGSAWIEVSRPGSQALCVMNPGGAPLELVARSLDELASLMLTAALANDRTVTGMCRQGGLTGSSMIQFVTGTDAGKDIWLNGVLRYLGTGGLSLYARPQHRSRRDARLAAEVSRALARST